jgi:transposase
MVTDRQVRKLMSLIKKEKSLASAAAKAGMDEKTAAKYLELGKLPSEVKKPHTWRNRPDPFEDVWDEVTEELRINPGLEAKTLFEDLQRCNPGIFPDGQLRTFQRRVKVWKALEGRPKEVFFDQIHRPGELCQSDFTRMGKLGVTILGQPFPHLWYHFVLTYSNWETGTICFSESFESLSEGLQNALWELGGVPKTHRTDRLSTAVNNTTNRDIFTQKYSSLLSHYGLGPRMIQAEKPHENGDVEQLNNRFKKAVDQALMLRGSRDFESKAEYEAFLRKVVFQLNANRKAKFEEELAVLRRLPLKRLESATRLKARVRKGSTILVKKNVYSVDSRLIGEHVDVRLYMDHLEIWYAQKCVETIPRLRGEGKHRINYRHVIYWLVRKPGAFTNYRYREDLFPTTRFRIAFDDLRRRHPSKANHEYLSILHMAAKESETAVDDALRILLEQELPITAEKVKEIVQKGNELPAITDVTITTVDLSTYDSLLSASEVSS